MQIAKALGQAPTDFVLYSEEGKQLNLDDRLRIKDLPFIKNGSNIEARLLKAPPKPAQSGIGVKV